MSQENVEVARRALDAFFARDVEAWVACHDESAEVLLPRNVIEGGSYKGHDGFRRAFADAYETWGDLRVEVESAREVDDLVLILGRATNVGKGDAPTVEFQGAYHFKIRSGRIVHFRPYQSHQEALEAVGLRE